MEWISVKDMLPERGKQVLVYSDKSMFMDIASRPSELELKVYEGGNMPENTFDNADWFYPSKIVTHWMPLPEPPKK